MPALLSGFLQRQRLAVIRPFLTGDVLDLGCGNARLVEHLLPSQVYVGVEGNKNFIAWLRIHRSPYVFYERNLDQSDLDLPQRFDTIVMLALVEHLASPERLFRQLPRYLKSKGRILITTPSPIGHRIQAYGAHLGLFSREAAEDHKTIFTLATLSASLQANGLSVFQQRMFLFGGNQLCICGLDDQA